MQIFDCQAYTFSVKIQIFYSVTGFLLLNYEIVFREKYSVFGSIKSCN